jgi:hypothetical protein
VQPQLRLILRSLTLAFPRPLPTDRHAERASRFDGNKSSGFPGISDWLLFAKFDIKVKMLLQSDFISDNSLLSCTFSFLSLSFSSARSAGAVVGDEFVEITCSSPEFDGDIIGFAVEITAKDTVTGAGPVAIGDVIFRR